MNALTFKEHLKSSTIDVKGRVFVAVRIAVWYANTFIVVAIILVSLYSHALSLPLSYAWTNR